MKRTMLLLAAGLSLAACTDRYGRPDVLGNALLGGLGGAAVGGLGSAALRDQQPSYRGGGYGRAYHQPHGYGGGYGRGYRGGW